MQGMAVQRILESGRTARVTCKVATCEAIWSLILCHFKVWGHKVWILHSKNHVLPGNHLHEVYIGLLRLAVHTLAIHARYKEAQRSVEEGRIYLMGGKNAA